MSSSRERIARALPVVGLIVVATLFVLTADRAAVATALSQANLVLASSAIVIAVVLAWLVDALCLTWVVKVALPDAERRVSFREMLAVKAWSYLLNVVNYNAATVGMGFAVARRVGVPALEATAALAVLSYLDLLALGVLVSTGLALNPDVLVLLPEALRSWLAAVVGCSFLGGLGILLLLQSSLEHPLLHRLRGLQLLRPLAALGPLDMLVGLLLRAGFVQIYVGLHYSLMVSVGLEPRLATLWVVLPVITLVGVVPISVSGIGTTQVAMRVLYASFVPAGASVGLIDAFSSLMIAGVTALRLLLSVPFLQQFRAEKEQAITPRS